MLPTRAPNAVPSPPSVTPANISSSSWKPIWKLTCSDRPWRMPPSAARPAPAAQTKLMTRLTSMPDDSARSRLSATARMALPIRVRCRNNATATSTTIEMTMPIRSRGTIDTGPISMPSLQRELGVGAGQAAELEVEDVAHQDAEADADDQHGDEAGAPLAQRPPEEPVDARARQHRDQDGHDRRGDVRASPRSR